MNDDHYYGITIYRFYIKCSHCSSEITFKTDPRNADYAAEHGASRNFEPWREKEEDKEPEPDSDEEKEESESEVDPMKALEQRMEESQREMEVMDALQDIRTRNARLERMDTNTVLDAIAENKRKAEPPQATAVSEDNEEDEALVRKFFSQKEQDPDSAVVPDTTHLLSDRAREQIRALATPTNVPKPTAKRKRGPNALGIVRKT